MAAGAQFQAQKKFWTQSRWEVGGHSLSMPHEHA
jgi:hypothetical protein